MLSQFLDLLIFEKNVLKNIRVPRLKREEIKAEPIHVVMNAPSLKNSKFFIKEHPGKVLMANSAICHLSDFEVFPDYYCLADSAYYEVPLPSTLAVLDMLKEYKKDLIIFLPSYFPHDFSSKLNHEVRIVNATALPHYYSTGTMVKTLTKNSASPDYINVSILGLYVALQLGYKEIYLHGCDLNILGTVQMNVDNQWFVNDDHCYGEKENVVNASKYTLGFCLECDARAHKNLGILRKYADACGAEIINMSPNSWVECFRKFRIEEWQSNENAI